MQIYNYLNFHDKKILPIQLKIGYNKIKKLKGDYMKQNFPYYIKKVLNRIFLKLILSISLIAILIIAAIIFRFRILGLYIPYVYLLLGLVLLIIIIIYYLSYRVNIWILENYQNNPDKVLSVIENIKTKENKKSLLSYLFYLFNKRSFPNYNEAVKLLNPEVEKDSE